jgi:hypothetical protein
MHRDYPWTGMGYLARLTFEPTPERLRLTVEACPYQILGTTPTLLDSPAEQAHFQQHLVQVSRTAGGSRVGKPGEHGCMRLEPPEP